MASNRELVAAGRLVGDALAGLVGAVAHVHRAISDRAFDALGPSADPARAAHDALSGGVYATVRAGHAVTPRVGAAVSVISGRGSETSRWSDSPRAAGVLSAISGIRGDHMAARYSALAPAMTLRTADGVELAMDRAAIASTVAEPTGRIVVFVHGLCESDRWWRHRAEERHGDPDATYGSMLQRDLGCTPLYLRYNSGLAVHDNGRLLDELLDDLLVAWPVAVDEIAFVGHSMGGLVARSACHQADDDGRPWAATVRHVVCLGTPHLGAPLARAVDRLVPALGRYDVAAPLVRLLDDRSAGVRDLEHGLGTGDDLPLLAHADWTFIGATLTWDPHHPVGRLLGDLLVHYRSATGPSGPADRVVHLGGLSHLDLLGHPVVYDEIRRSLDTSR